MSGTPVSAICEKLAECRQQPPLILTVKGSDAINRASATMHKDDIHMTSPMQQPVHKICRQSYAIKPQETIVKAQKNYQPRTKT